MDDSTEPKRLSLLLERARTGAPGALASVFENAYPQLCVLASARLRGRGQGGSLETTALVHETFLRFARRGELQAEDRAHFFKYAGRVMRSVIVDGCAEWPSDEAMPPQSAHDAGAGERHGGEEEICACKRRSSASRAPSRA